MTRTIINHKSSIINARGFTLIELLVVIAIIALLMAILVPTLSRIKRQAAGSVCQSNQHQLVLAWILYAQDNDDRLIGGHDGYASSPSKDHDWVQLPYTLAGTVIARASATLEDEIRGCERGALFPYVKDVDLYHCPGDRRNRTEMTHRSYGIPGGMNGDVGTGAGSWLMQQWGYPSYKKLTEIKNPGIKYVFLEEKTDVGGYNWGSWNLEKQGDRWWDPIVVRHGRLSVLAFSDGHAVPHQWQQKSTLAMTDVPYPTCIRWPVTDGTDDLQFMRQGFNPAR
ncbi:MAG: type II secretion system GspH family protein [Planctomycetes bacterium]|jgi:prepilin-type N-terminal cleavage/methylation domain-containing protein|nr:type II secretion system GspH family protein [Planctomycetota bacterium]